jgi:DNA-binding ferritin-like protein
VERIKQLSKQAETTYREILSQSIIDWKNEGHVAVVGSMVYNLQIIVLQGQVRLIYTN